MEKSGVKKAKAERRFRGALSNEYALIRKALPHCDDLQRHIRAAVAAYRASHGPIRVIEIGCGTGVTSEAILSARTDLTLTALDNEVRMVRQAVRRLKKPIAARRCQVLCVDALAHLRRLPARSVDLVASALTLHNMNRSYRDRVHQQIFRVLKPRGLFVNADKLAPDDDRQRFVELGKALSWFFKAFVPAGRYDLLREWVLHNVADQGPDRVMKEKATMASLKKIGFTPIRLSARYNMEAVLHARKPAD